MAATVKRSAANLGDPAPVELAGCSDRGYRRIDVVDEKAGDPVRDQLAHRASRVGDDRRATGHRLDDAVAERLVEVDQVEQGVRTPQYFGALRLVDGAEVAHLLAVDVRRDLVAEVLLVLDDPGDVESAAAAAGDLDRVGGALVGVDPSEEQQMLAGARMDRELVDVDAVVDGGGVVQIRMPIGVADRHVRRCAVVALVDRE